LFFFLFLVSDFFINDKKRVHYALLNFQVKLSD